MKRLLVFLLVALVPVPLTAGSAFENELELIGLWLDAQRAYDRVPGLSAAIVHDQELIWSAAYGKADLENERPARPDTIYQRPAWPMHPDRPSSEDLPPFVGHNLAFPRPWLRYSTPLPRAETEQR